MWDLLHWYIVHLLKTKVTYSSTMYSWPSPALCTHSLAKLKWKRSLFKNHSITTLSKSFKILSRWAETANLWYLNNFLKNDGSLLRTLINHKYLYDTMKVFSQCIPLPNTLNAPNHTGICSHHNLHPQKEGARV